MGCHRGIDLLNMVFEIKFLDDFMGREDPKEVDIYRSFVLLFVLFLLSWLTHRERGRSVCSPVLLQKLLL